MDALIDWKNSPTRKPLVLRGARQVGKTWLLREVGRTQYEQVAYVNCQRDRTVGNLFEGNLDPQRLLQGLSVIAGVQIEPDRTLLIIDEIQDAPGAVTALKYFAEDHPDIHVAAAGSLLGVALRAGASFPVGKVNFVSLHPLDFGEFLRGNGKGAMADIVDARDWATIAALRNEFIELLRFYCFVGGMPEAVAHYADTGSLPGVRSIQADIITGYENDFAKHATGTESRRIMEVWSSMPAQLAREHKRFLFGHVRDGGRGRDYDEAIRWLADAGLVHKVTRFTKPASPARTYEDRNVFKLFMHDVGLLSALSSLNPALLLDGSGVFEEFTGALTEQYVLQQFVALRDEIPMYWAPENGRAELDFALEASDGIVPIEVKAEENLQSKSLRSYINRFAPPAAFRFSLANYREEAALINVPLYAISPFLATDGAARHPHRT
jgi:uncharacterized protein